MENQLHILLIDFWNQSIYYKKKLLQWQPIIMKSVNQLDSKHKSYSIRILNEYLDNFVAKIDSYFLVKDSLEQNRIVRGLNSCGLTNGKFYDYAVCHEVHKDSHPKFYSLIENNIEFYLQFERKMKEYSLKLE